MCEQRDRPELGKNLESSLAATIRWALCEDSPDAHVDRLGVDERLVIDGRFALLNVARLILSAMPKLVERPPTPAS